MSLCQCVTMPQPPGVDPNHTCVTDYNARNATNCSNFQTACAACGNDEVCQRASRDLYLQACLGSLYQLAECLAAAGVDPPQSHSDWEDWADEEGEGL